MRRFFTLIMLMLALAVAAVANPVDLKTAKQVGFQFLQGSTAIKLPAAEALSLATVYSTAAGVPAFYVFNADAGFVIVSADDCATPILGYSNKGRFNPDELPIQMEAYLQSFVAQIQYGIEHHLQAEAPVAHRWELVCTKGVLTDEKATTVVEPLISAAWGQGCNYNDHCPDDVNGPCQHVLVGCVAVAMGQIMHYWGYPTIGNGSYGYYPDGYPYQGVNFGATTYQWNNMPNSLDGASATQVDAVATLLWHCGVAVDMQYGVNASGAYSNDVPNALTGYFRYANDLQYLCRYDYSTSQWVAKMKESLDLGRPIYYSGVDTDGQGGHAFVCDGYDASNLLHFNWGWYGNQDNYFAVDALDVAIYHFNDWNCAIIHIHPDNETNFAVSASASPANGGAVSGAGYYPSGTTCTLTATSNIGYHFSHWSRNGVQVSTNPTYSFTVTQDVSFVAHFQQSGSFQSSALGYTTYDWQSNDGARTWTIAWPDGKVSFAYTSASDNTFSDRGTAIDTYNPGNGTWSLSGGRVENEKTGFGTIARYGSNGIVVASHTPTDCAIYIVPNKDNVTSNSVSRTLTLDPTNDPCWPNVMTSGPNRTIIHVIATASDNHVSGMGNVTDPMIYFRSSDGGQTWDRQNVVLPYMGSSDAIDWTSNCCYWMETTDDNCLTLVVNNAWSDGMVLYSYDDGETWQRKVFFKHPNPSATFDGPMYYPRWTSCKWDSQHHLHVLYEFNGTTGAPGSGSFYPSIGGVAYWNETMPYAIGGNAQSAIAGNLVPGQPFVMDSAYLHMDVYNSWWLLPSTTHEMWPEYVGYLPPLTGNGIPENPYNHTGFNIADRSLHGSYNSGVCAFPVLCMVPGTDEMVAVWSAMDENHTDLNGNYYYKLFARYSSDEGQTWSDMVQLTGYSSQFDNMEFIYNQAAVVGRKLVVASQADGTTGTYVQSDDDDPNDNHYRGFVFDIDALFATTPVQECSITVEASPASMGSVQGGGTYPTGASCEIVATPANGCCFDNWTKNGVVVSSNATFSFIVTESAHYVAHFSQATVTYQVTATVNPTQGGSVSGTGPYEAGSLCELVATANPGYQFVKWTRNGAQVSVNSHYSFTVTQDVSLVAHFEQQTVYFTISASADPAEGGDVYGADVYPAGSVCTLTAAPRQGYEFVNWTKNGSVVSTNPSFSFNVTGDASYVAHFERIYTVTVAADPSEGGVVHGGGTYHYGASASVSVDLNPNYEFVQWTLNGTVVSDYPSYTFVVMGDCHLVAHLSFVDDVNDVAASVLSVSPNPAQDKLTVRGEAMHSVRVFNLQGQLVLSEECANADHVELNLSSLSAGIYTVSVRLAEGRVVNRLFVKE